MCIFWVLAIPLLVLSADDVGDPGKKDSHSEVAKPIAAGDLLAPDFSATYVVGEGSAPKLFQVGFVAILAFAAVAALDVLGHLAEEYIEDPGKQEIFDHHLDGTAAFLCLVIAFLWHGILQEFIMTQQYTTGFFPSAAFLVLVNRMFAVTFALIWMLITQEALDWPASWEASLPGALSCLASFPEEKALVYLTFPVVSVFKSSKIVPTMGVNTVVNGERHSWRDYFAACCISASVVGFSICCRDDQAVQESGMQVGIAMMCAGLVLDSYVSCAQKRIFQDHADFSNIQAMFVMGIFASGLALCLVLAETGIGPMLTFINDNPECIKHIIGLGVSSTAGTYFIMYIINHQGPVVLAIMMVIRQVVSIFLSSILFDHPLTLGARAFAGLTFICVLARPMLKLLSGDEQAAPPKRGSLRPLLRVTSALTRQLRGKKRRDRLRWRGPTSPSLTSPRGARGKASVAARKARLSYGTVEPPSDNEALPPAV